MAWRVSPRKQRGFMQLPKLRQFWFGGRTKPIFDLGLQTSLVPGYAKGSGTPTFTRATTAYVQDWEGLWKQVLSGEARFTGARRVQNRVVKSEDFTDASWLTVADATKQDATHITVGTNAISGVYVSITPNDGSANQTGTFSAIISVASFPISLSL